MEAFWNGIFNHWFEILLSVAFIVAILRIIVSLLMNPAGIAGALENMFSGVWADIRVAVLIIAISVCVGLAFILKGLDKPYTALLWAVGLLAVSWLIGFLFGIPKVLQGDASAGPTPQGNAPAPGPAAPGGDPKSTSAAATRDKRNQYQVNTNLEQISDWLTKIIVGLGLINLKQIPELIQRLSNFMAPVMGGDAQVFAAALFLYFSAVGFLGGYITTRLWLAGALARADQSVGLDVNNEERSVVMRGSIDFENPTLNAAADQAAKKVVNQAQTLDQLTNKDDIAIWAKAQLSQGNYESAVNGYAKAVQLSPNDIDLRLEYSVALYYAKRPATLVTDQLMTAYNLMKGTPSVSQDIKRRVYRSITYHFLFQPPPEGFNKAIQYGEEYVNDPSNQPITSGAIWVNLASAYGQKARWLTEHREGNADFEAQFKQASDSALNAVRKAIEIDSSWKTKLTELLVKNSPGKDKDEDDLEIFEKDNDFRRALGLPEVQPPTDAPPSV